MATLSNSEANASDKLADFEDQLKEAKMVAEESDRFTLTPTLSGFEILSDATKIIYRDELYTGI